MKKVISDLQDARHVSVDIETFANSPDAALAAIGAAAWAPGERVDRFYITVSDPDGRYDPETIRWHARGGLPTASMGADQPPNTLKFALNEFSLWARGQGLQSEGGARLWAHATFDLPILDLAFNRAGLSVPWHYRNARDLRTLYDLTGGRPDLDRDGMKHHAVQDAFHQLIEVVTCLGIESDLYSD